ncbi:ParA family protein, partial [Fusobacterium mortiferum]|nr:ParA family protein [Fusobacterium mortiferum]
IQAILVNLYRATVTQKDILNKLKMMLEDTDVVFPEPIKETSITESLVKKGKTVWESKSKSVEEAQNSLLDIIVEM